MQEPVAVIVQREKVSLDLDALVTAAHVGLSKTVSHAGKLLHQEGEISNAHIPGVHGVLKGEGTLELAEFHGELPPAGPLDVEILHVRSRSVGLELDAILEVVEDAAIHIQTDEPAVEPGAAVCTIKVTVLVTSDDVAAHLGHAGKAGLFVTVFRGLTPLRHGADAHHQCRSNKYYLFHIMQTGRVW